MNAPTSCLTCPSYLTTSQEQVSKFKRAIGAPMCGRYGKVLGAPNMNAKQLETIADQVGNGCPGHGQQPPPTPEQKDLTVALPDPVVLAAQADIDPDAAELVRTCTSCKFFIKEEAVRSELGWTLPMCAAKGKLLLGHELTYNARNCDMKDYGMHRDTTQGMDLLPVMGNAFALGPQDTTAKILRGEVKDPSEHETDAEVTPEQYAQGIRAWRRLVDPEGTGNSILLPIYDVDRLPDELRVLVPRTGDDEHPEDYADHMNLTYKCGVLWRELDETPALWGMPGTGKTEFFRHMAWLMNLPFIRISITGSTELDDLAGKMHLRDGETRFEYGRLPKAWMAPGVIVIDEPNVGPPDVWQFIRPLTDNSKQLIVDMNNGERILRNDDCYLGMAMNPAWDIRNVGAQQIGDADGSRLLHFEMEMPPPAVEMAIIKKACSHDGYDIPPPVMKQIMDIANEIRNFSDSGTLPITWGIRPQIKVARLTKWFSMKSSYRAAAADFLEPPARQILMDVVRAHAGD